MKRSLALLLIALWSGQVLAQTDYPNRPVRVIAPFPPGQGTELIARAVAAQLTVQMGQNFFVENRPGAAGIIGTEAVKNAAPDGYTLLVAGGGPFAINMAMYAKLPYDTLRDFQPIGMIAAVPNVLVVSNDFPATSVKELLAHAAKQGEKLNYASSGVGVPNHLIMEMLKSAAGLRMTHVPYKGAAASIAALISGEIGLMFETPGAIVPHIRSGRVRALVNVVRGDVEAAQGIRRPGLVGAGRACRHADRGRAEAVLGTEDCTGSSRHEEAPARHRGRPARLHVRADGSLRPFRGRELGEGGEERRHQAGVIRLGGRQGVKSSSETADAGSTSRCR